MTITAELAPSGLTPTEEALRNVSGIYIEDDSITSENLQLPDYNYDDGLEVLTQAELNDFVRIIFNNDIEAVYKGLGAGDEKGMDFAKGQYENFMLDLEWAKKSNRINSEQQKIAHELLLSTIGTEGQKALGLDADDEGDQKTPSGDGVEVKPALVDTDKKISENIDRLKLQVEARDEAKATNALKALYKAIKIIAKNDKELIGLVQQFSYELQNVFSGEDRTWLDEIIAKNPMEGVTPSATTPNTATGGNTVTKKKKLGEIKAGLEVDGVYEGADAEAMSTLITELVAAMHERDEAKSTQAIEAMNALLDQIDPDGTKKTDVRLSEILSTYLSNEDMDWFEGISQNQAAGNAAHGVVPTAGGGGVDADRFRDAVQGAVDQDQTPDKKTLKARLKARLTKLRTAWLTQSPNLAFEAVFGNANGEKAKRNAVIFLGVGATALAVTAILLNRKGVDISHVQLDNDGSNVNPFDGAEQPDPIGAGGADSLPGSEVPPLLTDLPLSELPVSEVADAGNNFDLGGIDLSTTMPDDVAVRLFGGSRKQEAINNMMDELARRTGKVVEQRTNGMIYLDGHITTPAELLQENQILVNQAG